MLSITFSYFHYKNLVATSPPQLMKGLSCYFQGMSPKGWVNMIIGPFYWILKTKPFHGCSKRCIMNIHKGTLGVEPRTCRTAAGCSTTELYPPIERVVCGGTGRNGGWRGGGQKEFVRSGIWTHALIRGPEFSLPTPYQGARIEHLESGALDHSAILTVGN